MNKQFAIFDFDGTLVDSMGCWQQIEREYLLRQGVTRNIPALLEEVKPLSITQAGEIFRRVCGLPGTAQSIGEEMQNAMTLHYQRDIGLKEGVLDYLSALRRDSVRLCVASATEKGLVQSCLRRLGAETYFEFFLSCVEVDAGKDRPDVYLAAASRFGAPPQEIAVYEDALTALRTAKRAGFYTVGVYDAAGAEHWEEIRRLADESLPRWPVPAGALS